MNAAVLGWGLALLAVVAGFVSYGWQGVLLALTVIAFWLLLQFSRSLRVLRDAAGRPVGHIDNAVMLHARLQEGMRLPQVLKLTRSLGRKVEGDATVAAVAGIGGAPVTEESFAWADAAGDRVQVTLRGGRLVRWSLQRAAAESPPAAAEAAAGPTAT